MKLTALCFVGSVVNSNQNKMDYQKIIRKLTTILDELVDNYDANALDLPDTMITEMRKAVKEGKSFFLIQSGKDENPDPSIMDNELAKLKKENARLEKENQEMRDHIHLHSQLD